jgi:class 3 adenylate cyclase
MRDALAHHDAIVRDAVEGHDGQVVKSTGDGALAAFRSAAQGGSAAVTAQSAL